MRKHKHKRLSAIPRRKRERPYVYGKLGCLIYGDTVSLETRCLHCNCRVVLACNTHEKVTAWLDLVKRDMETKVYEKLSSTQKRKAIAEVEDILGETKTN